MEDVRMLVLTAEMLPHESTDFAVAIGRYRLYYRSART